MHRVPPLFLALGMAILLLGLSLTGLQGQSVASAALPDGHPDLTTGSHPLTTDALLPTTLNDFFLPGTQPNTLLDQILTPEDCRACHAEYSDFTGQPWDTETWTAWQGSMMAQAGRDPLFYAALDIANADANQSGDVCLRCHAPRGWLNGRSSPTDGSALNPVDLEGVQCEVCHRMVDPFYDPENPDRDLIVLAGISPALEFFGSGAIIVDPLDERRGPFDLQEDWAINPHSPLPWPLKSPFHQEGNFCGSCHDVSNPLLSWDETAQSYVLNDLDTPAPDPAALFPVERTYSEWKLSEYNTPEGVYAPQFGGNRDYVSTCQHCHMRTITGAGANFFGNYVIRDDMPTHDLTGANTWIPQTLPLHPEFGSTFTGPNGQVRAQALISGTLRARYMLENAATMSVVRLGNALQVRITNQTGHKLPTGYPEGRRMWLQVEAYDEGNNLIYTSGAYDYATGELVGYGTDPTLQVYEVIHGLSDDWAAQLGLPAGESFHFILNNTTLKDNRIPPRGYDYDAFLAAGAAPYTNGQPDPARYANGQYWDIVTYVLPNNAAYGVVRLLYQTTSSEYIDFLKDNSPFPGDPNNRGEILYDLWLQTDRSRPELMAEIPFAASSPAIYLPAIMR